MSQIPYNYFQTMAEWWAEGFLRALTEESNKDSSQLLQVSEHECLPTPLSPLWKAPDRMNILIH